MTVARNAREPALVAEADHGAGLVAPVGESSPRALSALPVTTPDEIAVIVALDAAYRRGVADALLLPLDQAEDVRRVLRIVRLRDYASAKFPGLSKRAQAIGVASLLRRRHVRDELKCPALSAERLRKIL